MGKSLATMMGGIAMTAAIDPGWGETFDATFDPTAIPATHLGFYDPSNLEDVAGVICTAVSSWDLVGPVPFTTLGKMEAGALVPEGKTIPLDPEIVKQMPPAILMGIVQGLVAASLPKSMTTPNE